ncbi:MAG: hypothetical protein IJR50_01620 [Treponema sp.]|nr:hypothetical protein [Treponema sp.]
MNVQLVNAKKHGNQFLSARVNENSSAYELQKTAFREQSVRGIAFMAID